MELGLSFFFLKLQIMILTLSRLTRYLVGLGIKLTQSKEEKLYINHSSKLCPKLFDLCIKRFCKRIGSPVCKEVQYLVVMFVQCSCYDIKAFKARVVHFVIPTCK